MKNPVKKLSSFIIVLTYAVIAGLWIFFSDHLLAEIILDPQMLTQFQTYKGWLFVAVTAFILYLLLKAYQSTLNHYNHDIERLLVSEQNSRIDAENSKQQVIEILERVSDAFVSLDNNWIYTHVNKQAAELFNRTPEQLIGRHIWTEFPEGVDQPFYKAYYKAMEEQNPLQIEEYYAPWDRWFENYIYPSKDGLTIFFHDTTKRKKAQEDLKTLNEELCTINRISNVISGKLALNDIFETALDESLNITGLEGGTICLVTPDETLQLAAHRATSEAAILDLTTNNIKIGECLCGNCARDKKSLILRSRKEALEFATRESIRGEDIRFHAAFPMIKGDKCLGVLCVFTRTDNKPSERGLRLIEMITPQIALAIENAQLYEKKVNYAAALEDKVKERTAELENKISEIERMNKLFVGRELRMAELKEKIKELEGQVANRKGQEIGKESK